MDLAIRERPRHRGLTSFSPSSDVDTAERHRDVLERASATMGVKTSRCRLDGSGRFDRGGLARRLSWSSARSADARWRAIEAIPACLVVASVDEGGGGPAGQVSGPDPENQRNPIDPTRSWHTLCSRHEIAGPAQGSQIPFEIGGRRAAEAGRGTESRVDSGDPGGRSPSARRASCARPSPTHQTVPSREARGTMGCSGRRLEPPDEARDERIPRVRLYAAGRGGAERGMGRPAPQ